jgi:hypothetical protein
LLLWPLSAWSQLSVTAEVNKTEATLEDQIVLAVTVTGPQASLPDPQMPDLQNFSIYSSGRNQSISFINGRVSSSITHSFVLVPRAVGKAVIPPITVAHQGSTAKTEPMEILITRASGQGSQPPGPASNPAPSAARRTSPSGTPDLFLTVETDKRQAFVNEQVTLSVKFHQAVTLLSNPEYVPPKLEGFLTEDLPPLRHYNANIKGRTYYVTEIKTALFPLRAGRLTIGPATVRAQTHAQSPSDPFAADFFERFFSQGLGAAQTRNLASQPLTLTVEPLPEAGKPQDFCGAVGRFSFSAGLDKKRGKVGEPVTLSVTVNGSGNLKALGDPALPALPSWRTFDPVTSVNQEKTGDVVRGSRAIRTVLVARVSGELTIPPLSLSYFDPGRRAYVRLTSQPLSFSAAGDPAAASAAAGFSARAAPINRPLTKVNEDIAYLKTRPTASALSRALAAASSAGPLHALPLLLFACALGISLYRERVAADPKGARFRGAARAAAARMRAAQRSSDPKLAISLLSEALTHYLADKLGEPAASLTPRGVDELMQKRNVSAACRQALQELWSELDLRRFAPAPETDAAGQEGLSQSLLATIRALEKEIKS